MQRSTPSGLGYWGSTDATSLAGGQAATRISGRSATSITANCALLFIGLLPPVRSRLRLIATRGRKRASLLFEGGVSTIARREN